MLIASHHVPVDKHPLYFIGRKKLVDFLEIAMYLVWRNENVITKVRCVQRVPSAESSAIKSNLGRFSNSAW